MIKFLHPFRYYYINFVVSHKRTMISYLLIIVLFLTNLIHASDRKYIPDDWVDPTDMRNYDHNTKKMRAQSPTFSNSETVRECNISSVTAKDEIQKYRAFLKRFVNLVLYSDESTHLDKNETIKKTIRIFVSAEKLCKLRMLVNNIKSSDLRELDEILSKILIEESSFGIDDFKPCLKSLRNFSKNITWQSFSYVAVGIIFTVALWIFLIDRSLLRAVMFLFLVFYMGGLIWTWHSMYEDKVAEQMAYLKSNSNIPSVCSPAKVSFWNFKYYFSSLRDECKEYYEQVHIDPFIKVPPSLVISKTTSMMIIHPLKDLGSGLGDFIKGISGAAPWPLNIVFLPVVLLVTLLFVLLALGVKLHVWTLFGGLKFGSSRVSPAMVYPKINNEQDLKDATEQPQLEYLLINTQLVRQRLNSIPASRYWDMKSEYGQGDNAMRYHVPLNRASSECVVDSKTSAKPIINDREQHFLGNKSQLESSNENENSETNIRTLSNICQAISKSKINFRKNKFSIQKHKYR